METDSRETLQADFDAFDISEELGFILKGPLGSLIVICSVLIQQIFFVCTVLFQSKKI